jgi:hypothetical protein
MSAMTAHRERTFMQGEWFEMKAEKMLLEADEDNELNFKGDAQHEDLDEDDMLKLSSE